MDECSSSNILSGMDCLLYLGNEEVNRVSDKTDSESCVRTLGDVLELFEPYLDESDILEVIEELEKANGGEKDEVD